MPRCLEATAPSNALSADAAPAGTSKQTNKQTNKQTSKQANACGRRPRGRTARTRPSAQRTRCAHNQTNKQKSKAHENKTQQPDVPSTNPRYDQETKRATQATDSIGTTAHAKKQANEQTSKQTNKLTSKQANKLAKQASKQTNKQAGKQPRTEPSGRLPQRETATPTGKASPASPDAADGGCCRGGAQGVRRLQQQPLELRPVARDEDHCPLPTDRIGDAGVVGLRTQGGRGQ